MDSGCKGRAWVENLCHRFGSFCSVADDIISQLVEDVLPEFSVDSAGENGLVFPAHVQDVNFPALEMLSIGIVTDQDGKSCTTTSACTLSSIVPVGERCTDIQSDGKDDVSNCFGKQTLDGDECNVQAYSLTSAQLPVANSLEKMEESKNSLVDFQEYELPDDEVSYPSSGSTKAIQSNVCTPITESGRPSCCQKLGESIIMVNSDEFYSDSDMETNYLSLEKIANERSVERVSQGIYSEADQMTAKYCTEPPCSKDSRMVNEEFCDWEII